MACDLGVDRTTLYRMLASSTLPPPGFATRVRATLTPSAAGRDLDLDLDLDLERLHLPIIEAHAADDATQPTLPGDGVDTAARLR
ncbi:hypothetical protein ARTHRO9V_1250003 [Arthrobacter sp. 9V]|uniref:hypothetical protein n=1 Tax=Arthrobacter sp. 9V TaxID=2653132 RepID=UPI0012F01759|nr:hypothetical protein [Arthrobacter sp. 9V]VXB16454.1 hypothetical protein ARTHRO9V_1250003 [Arthrobacter sp. 9V]VXB95594.1 hypothetical protein CURTO8I2_320012 [Curtobacterium sp. 8I-2]